MLQFAKATGDLQSLSEVDMKLIALAYTLEAQAHGVSHLRSRPPPLQVLLYYPHFQLLKKLYWSLEIGGLFICASRPPQPFGMLLMFRV